MFWPPKCHTSYSKLLLDNSTSFTITKDDRLVSKMKGKTNFSRRLEQFDGLTWLTPTPLFYDWSTPLIIQNINCKYKNRCESKRRVESGHYTWPMINTNSALDCDTILQNITQAMSQIDLKRILSITIKSAGICTDTGCLPVWFSFWLIF